MRPNHQSPLLVGREREGFALSEQRRVGTVGLSQKGLEALRNRLVVVVEEKDAPVSREIDGVGLSEPGEVGLLRSARDQGEDVTAHVSIAAEVQGHAVLRHVLQPGEPSGRAHTAGEGDAPGFPALALSVAPEEDLVARGIPQRG